MNHHYPCHICHPQPYWPTYIPQPWVYIQPTPYWQYPPVVPFELPYNPNRNPEVNSAIDQLGGK